MAEIGLGLFQFFLILGLAPFFAGIIHKLKQNFRGQKGIKITQFYTNFFKLLKKEAVISSESSYISKIAPYIILSVNLLVLGILPAFYRYPLFAPLSDIIVIVYALSAATFFITLYSLDQGSPFGGLGGEREWFLTMLSEPSLIFIFVALAIYSKKGMITEIFYYIQKNAAIAVSNGFHGHFSIAIPFMLLISLFILGLSENARIPIDNPETHLELTMIHEANILEASGKYLGMLEYSAYIKLSIFLTFMSLILFPYMAGNAAELPFAVLLYLFKMLMLCFIIAIFEVLNPKMRLFRAPNMLSVAFIISLIAMILSVRGV